MAKQILIVEDDSDVVGYIEHLLKSLGYTVCAVVSSGQAAMQKAAEGTSRFGFDRYDVGRRYGWDSCR